MSGQLIGGRYRPHEVIGRGGMATVWRAVDERLGRPVAVKLLDRADAGDPAVLERFDREARTAAALSHPNIVSVHDVGRDGDVPYLVMELIDGPSLAARLAGGPLPVEEAVAVGAQVCDALAAAHAAGVVHRDIKPANVLLAGGGTVKVCDFGIAYAAAARSAGLTGPQAAVGTSEYMAPEQAAGGSVDARADLYALGCLLYAMLAGAPPFTGDNPLGVLWQHQHQPAVPVADRRPDTPEHLRALVAALLSKSPADRPATAEQVREMLAGRIPPPAVARAAVLSPTRTLPAVEPATGTPPRGDRFRLGPAGVAAVAVGAAVLAALAVGLLLTADRTGTVAGPTGTPTGTVATGGPTSRTADRPQDAVAALRATIDGQVRAGGLEARRARDLTDKIDDVDRALAEDEPDKAAEKVVELRRRLADLRKKDRISPEGYQAVLAGVDDLAGTLPTPERGRGDDE